MREELEALSDEVLLPMYEAVQQEVQERVAMRDRILLAIRQRMEERGASMLIGGGLEAKLEPGRPEYEHGVLVQLLELDVPQAMLDKAYIPEHQETVPARWNGTHLKTISNLGGEVASIIEEGTIRADPRVKITRKE
jgi:hypothetical protein